MGQERGANFSKAGLAAVALAAATIVAPALATPGSGFTPNPQSSAVFDPLDVKADKTGKWDLFLKTKDDSTIGVDKLSVIAGGQSGWHTHTGATLVTVTVGEVRWYDGENPLCTFTTYRAGDTFVEPANHVHLVHNATGAPAEIVAIQMRPAGTSPRVDVPVKPTNCPAI